MNSKQVNLGRTYFIPALEDLVIPVRKAIFDEQGTLLGVMSAGIRVKDSQLFKHNYANSQQPTANSEPLFRAPIS